MSRKLGCEKKPAFDHFSRDLGVDPFLLWRWVVRDSPAVRDMPMDGGWAVTRGLLFSFQMSHGTEAGCS